MNQPLKHLAYGPMGSRLKPSNFANPHLHFKLQGAFSTSWSGKKTVSILGGLAWGLPLALLCWCWEIECGWRLNCMEVELVIQVEHLQSGGWMVLICVDYLDAVEFSWGGLWRLSSSHDLWRKMSTQQVLPWRHWFWSVKHPQKTTECDGFSNHFFPIKKHHLRLTNNSFSDIPSGKLT